MASLIKDGVLLELTGQAPSPSKDYHQLLITRKEVIHRWWRISLRNDAKKVAPGELRETLEDFIYDDTLQAEIKRIFSESWCEYAKNLCQGNIDYIVRMPKPIQILMASYLELEDVASLAQTCKTFREVCNSDALWERIYEDNCDTVTEEVRSLAQDVGWKELFFLNKLQLQVKLRRKRGKGQVSKGNGDTVFLTSK
ncbi:F-box only protein 36-like [Saccoglossus kowalevskii]|uniref:F-box only protein 36-like n=1 Tax=Saccoglossus kowalevskii TaxID=10224 RepID=A0ABM0GMV2_SACKO|nr:PREDICTED: F-box only protein 36-like [Saccoglossus kowalevskii]